MNYWLVRTEPGTYSIADLERERRTLWEGVRNYQARNFLKSMQVGDRVLIYHSVVNPIGVVGIGRVVGIAIPDPTQFDQSSKYYDPAVTLSAPRWFAPAIEFVERFGVVVSRREMLSHAVLQEMALLKKGSRLSVTPLAEEEYELVVGLGRKA